MLVGIILHTVWVFVLGIIAQFWQWLLVGSGALLAFLFSATIRKYTLAVIAVLIIGTCLFLWGYSNNHNVETITHTCDEFRQWLVKGPATDKAIGIFQRHGLCV